MNQLVKLGLIVAASSFLQACNTLPNQTANVEGNTPTQNSQQTNLTWEDEVTSFAENVVRNHPAIRNAHVQIVQQEGGQWATYSDAIGALKAHLSYFAGSVDWHVSESNNSVTCAISPDYYLLIDRRNGVSLSLLDGQTRTPVAPAIETSLTHSQALISFARLNVEIEDTVVTAYRYEQVEEAGSDIAAQIACAYQASKLSDKVFNVSSQEPLLAPVVNTTTTNLVNFHYMTVGNTSNANTHVSLALYPQDDQYMKLQGITTDNTGNIIEALPASILLDKASWSSQLTQVTVSNKEQLIDHFFAVAPANYQDCDVVNPWQFGEQVLPSGVTLPHFGCFALKMSVKERSNTLLLAKSAEGGILRLAPSQCFSAVSNGGSSYPLNYAREQLVLELNETSGSEDIVFAASQFEWSKTLASVVASLPTACGESEVGAFVSWSDILSQLDTDDVDYKVVTINH